MLGSSVNPASVDYYSDYSPGQRAADIPPREKYTNTATANSAAAVGEQADHIASDAELHALKESALVFEMILNEASAKFSALRLELCGMRPKIYLFKDENTRNANAVLQEGVTDDDVALYIAKLQVLQIMQDSAKEALKNINSPHLDEMFTVHHSSVIYRDLRALSDPDEPFPAVYTSSDR